MTLALVAVWFALNAGFVLGLLWAHRCREQERRERMLRDTMSMIRVMSKLERVTPRAARQFVRDQLIEGVWSS